MRSAKPRLAYSSKFRVSFPGNQPSLLDFRRPVSGFRCFCVTVYVHRQVNSKGDLYQKSKIRTNSVTCTIMAGYATFLRTCGLPCREKWRTAQITLPQEPSRVALSGLYTRAGVYRSSVVNTSSLGLDKCIDRVYVYVQNESVHNLLVYQSVSLFSTFLSVSCYHD